MKTYILASALGAIISSVTLPVAAANINNLVSFDGGIGVTPVAINSSGVFIANDAMGVAPGGRPWAIKSLRAMVKPDGHISVRGEGLVFAGGNTVGAAGPVTQVLATLFCDAQPFHSQPATLERDGDFDIHGVLTATPPSPCLNPALLIRNAAGETPGAWFAAGIPK